MSQQSRREFLEYSLLSAAAAIAAQGSRGIAAEAIQPAPVGPNGKIGVAIVGMGGRGGHTHLPIFLARPDVEVLWVVEPDEKVVKKVLESTEKKLGHAPEFKHTRDMREAFADPAVDVVSIATPHHWHSLAAIWAMQAGKDVYVEKPVSHNVSEGRRCVEVARKYNRICQTGTQCRSFPGTREAIQFLRDGKMGAVKVGRGLCYKERKAIGPRGTYTPPETVDYGLWLGPAPDAPLTREPEKHFHYDWHWQWPYGNGDLGNQGVHQMDIARWGLGLDGLCNAVFSYGGRVGYEEPDAGDTPNTQVVMCDYGDKTLTFEVRGLTTGAYPRTTARVGVIFESDDGRRMVFPNYFSAVMFDKDMKPIQEFKGENDNPTIHFANFLDAVRSRKVADLTADILEGHVSSALCHLGNISYQLGQPQNVDFIAKNLPAFGGAVMQETFKRTGDHLEENDVDPDTRLQLGATLKFDPARETFIDNAEADKLLTREYRAPFVVPTSDKI